MLERGVINKLFALSTYSQRVGVLQQDKFAAAHLISPSEQWQFRELRGCAGKDFKVKKRRFAWQASNSPVKIYLF